MIEDILGTLPNIVEDKFIEWSDFMYENIEFKNNSLVSHTFDHYERVLLFSLLIAYEMGNNDIYDKVAHSAIFHDTMRLNDWDDEYHGKRGADYYKEFCALNNIQFNESSWYAIYYHDIDDEFGFNIIDKNIQANDKDEYKLIFTILKDADALDRYRFGEIGLDEKYLRTKESKSLKSFAIEMFQ